jgi:hypothetical membrane protein
MTFPLKHTVPYRQVWIGVVCMLLLAGFVGIQVLVQAHVALPYSLHDEPISNLGATACDYYQSLQSGDWAHVCSPYHMLMNAGFVVYGVLVMLSAAFAVREVWPGRRLRSLATVVLFLGGIELVVVGCSPVNRMLVLHNVAGAIVMGALNLSLILLAVAAFRAERWLALWTLACGLAGVAGFIMTCISPYPWLGYGGWQRVALNAFVAWSVTTGLYWAYRLRTSKRA